MATAIANAEKTFMNTGLPLFSGWQHKVVDLSEDSIRFGRKVDLAEHEMPGLMATIAEYGDAQPLRAHVSPARSHMTVQTAVLAETLRKLGAEVRWASCNIFSTGPRSGRPLTDSMVTGSLSSHGKVKPWKSTGGVPFRHSIGVMMLRPA